MVIIFLLFLALVCGHAAIASNENLELSPEALEAFEEADCLDSKDSETLLALLLELCELLDSLMVRKIHCAFQDDAACHEYIQDSMAALEAWVTARAQTLTQLLNIVLAERPYCEPGKLAGTVASCILFLLNDQGKVGEERALMCAEDVDDMLKEITPPGQNFQTRFHLLLRSPWPVFRLLDAFVHMFPEEDDKKLGLCIPFKKWNDDPGLFDWPTFQVLLTRTACAFAMNDQVLLLESSDGPLSEQYRARWNRIFLEDGNLRHASSLAGRIFHEFRTNHYQAGCYPGVISAYALQLLVFLSRDSEAWLQRYVGAVAKLQMMYAPVKHLIKTNWPVFRILHVVSLMRRSQAPEVPSEEPRGGAVPAYALVQQIHDAIASKTSDDTVFVTAAWAHFSDYLGPVLERWKAMSFPQLLILVMDAASRHACRSALGDSRHASCVETPMRFGLEAEVAKYISLAAVARRGAMVVWVDLDVYFSTDPTPRLRTILTGNASQHLVAAFAGSVLSQSISPAVIAAMGSADASLLFLRYAAWLYESPYILDHQGWDSFLSNREGDYGSGVDYKGRNITSAPDDELALSFLPAGGSPPRSFGERWAILGPEFASGDGVLGKVEDLISFHFWGVNGNTQKELFEMFYPHVSEGFSTEGETVLKGCLRAPKTELRICDNKGCYEESALNDMRLHLVSISYAHGCCQQALVRNHESALSVGVDHAHAYNYDDLDPEWVAKHSDVLAERKGAGWWLWKPYLVYRTLMGEDIPWHRGVVLWLDAGNKFIGDPRPFLEKALAKSDVAALRLKCCIENDWTSQTALKRLGVDRDYWITDRPQLGAYFLAFRKTPTAVEFVRDWLRLSEDAEILQGYDTGQELPGYNRHMADQSILSVLFKQRGFHASALEEGHRVVSLDRWRE